MCLDLGFGTGISRRSAGGSTQTVLHHRAEQCPLLVRLGQFALQLSPKTFDFFALRFKSLSVVSSRGPRGNSVHISGRCVKRQQVKRVRSHDDRTPEQWPRFECQAGRGCT
jgi:hypothetical protein